MRRLRSTMQRPITLDLPNVAGGYLPEGAPPIRIETRPLFTAGGRHDLTYVSSYLHDATYRLVDIYESEDALVIPVTRMRLELPHDPAQEHDHAIVHSELLISPVKWWTMELVGRFFLEKRAYDRDMSIHALACTSGRFVAEECSDEEVVVDCTSMKLRVRVPDDAKLALVDIPPKRRKKRIQPVAVRAASPMA